MTVRGPAAATILFLKYVGYEPCPDQPWAWYCPGCPEADIDIARDGRSDIDDAIGVAVARAAWIRAADTRRDLGPPEARDALELAGPKATVSRMAPMGR